MQNSLLLIAMLFFTLSALAQPAAPILQVDTEGLELSLHWSEAENAAGYRLLYAPYPFQGEQSIKNIDLGSRNTFAFTLSQGAAFYVAIQAYDAEKQNSEYSNIGFLQIQDRGTNYRQYWRAISKEISEHTFASNDFLYDALPNVADCFVGTLTEHAQLRQHQALNQTRQLHQLPTVVYTHSADDQTQQTALIQRANNFLTHNPPSNSTCYSDTGFDGSNSSNLHLGSHNSDPAGDIIGFIDDASNVANILSVGHRRALLNPFLQHTSYGQVLGASAVKIFDFSDAAIPPAQDIPDYVAFPYLRYPFVFFSDKTNNKKTPWSLSIIEDKSSLWANQHNYFSAVELTVTQKDNAQPLSLVELHTDIKGNGIPNNLSWTVQEWQYDVWYTVTINNIQYRSGAAGSIQYDVLIDYKNIINLLFPLEMNDQQNGTDIQASLFTENDKDSFIIDLEGKLTFSGSSQFSNMAFFIAVYGPNKQLISASDKAFSLDLPAGEYTLVISNCHAQFCYLGNKNYTVQIN